MDPDPDPRPVVWIKDPALLFSGFQDAREIIFLYVFMLFSYSTVDTFSSVRIQVF
jgi:hypothetical protein